MRDGKNNEESWLTKVVFLVYGYMDWWLPVVLLVSFPLWILPALLYYSAQRSLQLWRCFFKFGNKMFCSQPHPELSYAILKGNGRYLRQQSQNVHKKQFYDYTSRRFMSIGEFEPESKIIELECDSEVGLQFFTENMRSGTVVGVQSNRQILKAKSNSLGLILPTDYSLVGQPVGYACMLLFNFKSKMKTSGGKLDLIKILSYCRFHMENDGYVVFGDYFEEGEVTTFISIFQGFKFRVAEQEDITKNIEYARKLANRKLVSFEQKILDIISNRVDKLLGKKDPGLGKKFIVLILEKIQ